MKIVCPQCQSEVINQFDNTLTFCTNCGGKLSFSAHPQSTSRNQFSTILLTSLLTSIIILALGGAGIFWYLSYNSNPHDISSNGGKNSSPTPRKKQKSSIPASEIERVVYTTWQHQGPLTSGTGSVVSESLSFSKDLTAKKTSGINYDDGDSKDRVISSEGKIDSGHFEKLAEIIVDNDFLNLPDSKERISNSDAFLIITYKSGEKKILTSNIDKDISEVADIIKTLKVLDSVANWKEINSKS